MFKPVLAAAALLLSIHAGLAPAHADPVGYYGNTLEIRRQGKLAGRIYYRPDHSYLMFTSHGQIADGQWKVVAGKLCLQPHDHSLTMLTLCVPDDPIHKLGDEWVVPSPEGTPETLTLVAGQHGGPITTR